MTGQVPAGHGAASDPDRAPYPVWATMRAVTALVQVYALVWVIVAMIALIDAINGTEPRLLPIWSFVIACIMGANGSDRQLPRSYDLPPFGEMIARRLAPKLCPSCGQSIFNPSPPSGYMTAEEQRSWWPSRICANCGYDLCQKPLREKR